MWPSEPTRPSPFYRRTCQPVQEMLRHPVTSPLSDLKSNMWLESGTHQPRPVSTRSKQSTDMQQDSASVTITEPAVSHPCYRIWVGKISSHVVSRESPLWCTGTSITFASVTIAEPAVSYPCYKIWVGKISSHVESRESPSWCTGMSITF